MTGNLNLLIFITPASIRKTVGYLYIKHGLLRNLRNIDAKRVVALFVNHL